MRERAASGGTPPPGPGGPGPPPHPRGRRAGGPGEPRVGGAGVGPAGRGAGERGGRTPAASTGAERAGDLGIVVLGSAVFVRASSAARNAVVKPALPNTLSPACVTTSRSCGAPVRETGASTIPFTARSRTLRLLLSRPTM